MKKLQDIPTRADRQQGRKMSKFHLGEDSNMVEAKESLGKSQSRQLRREEGTPVRS